MPREYRHLAELVREVVQFLEAVTRPEEIVIEEGPQSMGPSGRIEGPDHYAVRHRGGVSIQIERDAISVSAMLDGSRELPILLQRFERDPRDGDLFRVDLAEVLAEVVDTITRGRVRRLNDEDLNPVVWDGGCLPSGRALIEEVNRHLEEIARLPGTVEHDAIRFVDGQLEADGPPRTGDVRYRNGQFEAYHGEGWIEVGGFDWANPEQERAARAVGWISSRPPLTPEEAEQRAHAVQRLTLPSGEVVDLRSMTPEDEARIQRGVESGRGIEDALRPMVVENDAPSLTSEQRARIEAFFRVQHGGRVNAMRPAILEGTPTIDETAPSSSQIENESSFGRAVRKRIREAAQCESGEPERDPEE